MGSWPSSLDECLADGEGGKATLLALASEAAADAEDVVPMGVLVAGARVVRWAVWWHVVPPRLSAGGLEHSYYDE